VAVSPTRTLAPRVDCVGIGSSMGGPAALAELLARLPGPLPVPIIVVQHIQPSFVAMLAERLSRERGWPVRPATPGARPGPGEVWIAPGGRHLVLERVAGAVVMNQVEGEPENSCRPSVDALFRSMAKVFDRHALGVVLTGLGVDGLAGSRDIKARGGQVMVQSRATSLAPGMPGGVAREGLADETLDLPELALAVWTRTARRWAAPAKEPAA